MNDYVLIPTNTGLNDFQHNTIEKPYNESGLARGIAYISETNGIAQAILSPSQAFSGYAGVDRPFYNPELNAAATSSIAVSTGAVSTTATAIILGERAAQAVSTACTLTPIALTAITAPIIGLAIFEGVIIIVNLVRIFNSHSYAAWKTRHIELMKSKAVVEFLNKDDILRHLLCPLTGKIPLLPVKDLDGNTYDYMAANRWVTSGLGQPLPGSTAVTQLHQLLFDYAHINSVVERLRALKPILVTKENDILRRDHLTPMNVVGRAADVWISTLRIMIDRGNITPAEAGGNHESLLFTGKVLEAINIGLPIATSNRLEFYRREFAPIYAITANPISTESERIEAFSRHAALVAQASVMKKIYVKTMPNQENGFVAFWRTVFFMNPYEFQVRREFDESVLCDLPYGRGWAANAAHMGPIAIDARSL